MATYTKLRDGTWGLREQGRLVPGTVVAVYKRDGSIKQERVGVIIWACNGVTLATIDADTSMQPSARRYVRGQCSCGSDCDCRSGGRCHCEDHCVCRGGTVYDC